VQEYSEGRKNRKTKKNIIHYNIHGFSLKSRVFALIHTHEDIDVLFNYTFNLACYSNNLY